MAEIQEKVQIAVNIMRARLTILGFNLAIITFQMNNTDVMSGGMEVPGFDHNVHVSAGTALLLGVALTVTAMVAYIASSQFDKVGTCDHWSVLAGDLLMYLALAQTVTAFFGPYHFVLVGMEQALGPGHEAMGLITVATTTTGAIAWALAMYVGPAVSLIRSPFGRGTTITLGIVYLAVMTTVSTVLVKAHQMELRALGEESTNLGWLGGFVQPLLW